MDEEGLTREDVEQYDHLASLPRTEIKMDWEERKVRMRNHAWEVVQGKGGGRQTIQTKLYPTYADAVEAKASAPPPPRPSFSSSSWTGGERWWSHSDSTPPWKKEEKWWQKRW